MDASRNIAPPSVPAAPSRRSALAGLVASAAGAVGAAAVAGAPAASAAPAAPAPAASPTPGAMQLFTDPGLNFGALLALGAAGARASEVGEVLTAVNAINAAGANENTYTAEFRAWGDRLVAMRTGHRETDRFRSLRASQYYAQALFFVLGSTTPGDEERLYRAGRRTWDTFARLCEPAAITDKVPYGKTPLPVWFFRPDTSGKPRPTVILTNGSDGQNVDMWTYGVMAALDRGWNALVYDGPGQGQLLFVDKVVFSPRWERVVGPLVDWLQRRHDVDHRRIALTGLSMGGDLAPRAAAFDHRIAALVAMPGCLNPWLAFPPELREILTPDKAETNKIWNEEVVPELDATEAYQLKKRFEPFSIEAMLAARRGRMFTDFWTAARRVVAMDITGVVRRIQAPTLVLDYQDEAFYPGQPRQMYELLRTRKDYLKLTAATGAQLHCSPMAPQQHCEVVFDWLEDTLGRRKG
ncbi:alpha/beta hydrolase [Streptomyces sp. NBRC 14336]|uniref:alpha/beta hydrolase family protein n=1 Tax=Streptomyces sp. NBRC 14336 TaxID=3030992 RepID=UPI0024A245BD|nr:acyl-CoA thioester hydrolase/BAAT C-terminal domain-containing protein [Streptomyces sp. NBRC 14336]WBO79827.1 alpha/beta hydrolase [Streptomyces sp. SBE_14.2]GLW45075.1 alpha/beta hydrolase [Streptomyces sp. NBRC 14336]